MERKLWNDVALGAFILAALGLLAYMSIAVGGLKVGRAVIVSATFDNAAGLVKDSAILVAGVNVGSVEALSVAHGKALVKLRLKTDAQLRRDIKAAIRLKSLLGEKYVELLPQSETAPLLADGDVIADTTVPVEVDELMKQVGPVLKDVDSHDVAAIVHAVALTVGGRGDSLGRTLDESAATLALLHRMLAKNEDKFDHLIASADQAASSAPGLLNRLDTLTQRLEPTTDELAKRGPDLIARVDRMSAALEPGTNALGRRAPALVDKTEKALDTLQPSLQRLPKTLDTLDRLVAKLETTLNALDPLLDQTKGREMIDRDGSIKVKAKLF